MSVESLAVALHHSRARGAAKLVLIGIANHDGDGGAWPAVSTLAKYAGVTERNVQKALLTLESLGEIKRLVSVGGDHSTADHMRPNLYRFLLRCPHDCDRSTRHRTRQDTSISELFTGVSVATPGVGSDTGGVSVATPEPSTNQTTNDSEETRVIARTRVGGQQAFAAAIADKCSMRRGQRHVYEESGYCRNCGNPKPDKTLNYNTGEVS